MRHPLRDKHHDLRHPVVKLEVIGVDDPTLAGGGRHAAKEDVEGHPLVIFHPLL